MTGAVPEVRHSALALRWHEQALRGAIKGLQDALSDAFPAGASVMVRVRETDTRFVAATVLSTYVDSVGMVRVRIVGKANQTPSIPSERVRLA